MKLFITALSLIALAAPSAYAYNPDRDNEYRDGVTSILYPDQQPPQTTPRPDVGSILYPGPQQPAPQPVYTPPPQPVVVTPPPAAPAPAPEPEIAVPTVGDTNSCVEGSVIGAVVGGAGAAAANEYLWNGDSNNLIWGIPAGALLGGLLGCQIDGG